jgi:hypothetical protein
MRWSLIAAVNDETVLNNSLLRSPDLAHLTEVILKRGFDSAGAAYNSGLQECHGDVAIFAHQDVYLPAGWLKRLEHQIGLIAEMDPGWGVVGLYGVDLTGRPRGHVYSTGLRCVLGADFHRPVWAGSVDEMVIVLRTQSGLVFDPHVPGFHLYGTDICLEAERQGLSCFLISSFCIHNSNGLKMMPWEFWRSYLFLRSKWRYRLPVITPCVTIHANIVRVCFDILQGAVTALARPKSPGRRVEDPALLYDGLLKIRT